MTGTVTGTMSLRLRALIAFLIVVSQDRIQATDRILLHTGQHMGVDIHRHTDVTVTQQFLHNLGMLLHSGAMWPRCDAGCGSKYPAIRPVSAVFSTPQGHLLRYLPFKLVHTAFPFCSLLPGISQWVICLLLCLGKSAKQQIDLSY